LIGNYKIGDLAIATMIKLGEKDKEVAIFKNMGEFDKKMIMKLYEDIDW